MCKIQIHGGMNKCLICLEAISNPIILPCDHIGCSQCIKGFLQDKEKKYCPDETCNKEIPNNFNFCSSEKIEAALKKYHVFRDSLNAFFLDYLQQFVFSGDEPPSFAIIEDLLNFVVTKELPKDVTKPRTKNISPFSGEYIDPTPIIRTYILQLLLRYNYKKVMNFLTMFIEEKRKFIENKETFMEMCLIVMYCMEDSYFTSYPGIENLEKLLGEEVLQKNNLLDQLNLASKIRILLDETSHSLSCILNGNDTSSNLHNKFVKDIITYLEESNLESENIKEYLIRKIVATQTLDTVFYWKKSAIFLELIPEKILKIVNNREPDIFIFFGKDYKVMRDAIQNSLLLGELSKAKEISKNSSLKCINLWTLAIYYISSTINCDTKYKDNFITCIREENLELAKNTEEILKLNQSLLSNQISPRQKTIETLLFHFKTVLSNLSYPDYLNDFFCKLFKNPELVRNFYFPTMPEDNTLDVISTVGGAFYTCPNGHIYSIGECGQPNQQSKCLDCYEQVGGSNHKFVNPMQQSFYQTTYQDKTLHGYVIKETKSNRGEVIENAVR